LRSLKENEGRNEREVVDRRRERGAEGGGKKIETKHNVVCGERIVSLFFCLDNLTSAGMLFSII
jgi:hypothetical protein